MRTSLTGCAILVVGMCSSAALAASDATDAFVSDVRVTSSFLAEASDIAIQRSDNKELRFFADNETRLLKAMIAGVDVRVAAEMAAQAEPLTLASNEVVTGRSAAIDRPAAATDESVQVGTAALMPAATLALEHLSASRGPAFDALFKATQVSVLRHLAAIFSAYAMVGDNAALKQLAKCELAATNDRIAEIARF